MRPLVILALALGLLLVAFLVSNAIEPTESAATAALTRSHAPERASVIETVEPKPGDERFELEAAAPSAIEPHDGVERTIRLVGRLTDSVTGDPIPYCPLVFEPLAPGGAQAETLEADTRWDGTFELAHRFAPGEIWVGVRNEAEAELDVDFESFGFFWLLPQDVGGERFVELTARRPDLVLEVIALHPDARMRETVVVTTIGSGRWSSSGHRTNSAGVARIPFFGDAATANVSFSARAAGSWVFGPSHFDPPLTSGPFELVATQGAELAVSVVSNRETPLTGASVSITSRIPGVNLQEELETDDEGQAVFAGLFPGEYSVSAHWGEMFISSYASSTIFAGQRNSTRIALGVVGTTVLLASGQVVDENGAPLENVSVGGLFHSGRTDSDGRFEIWGDAGWSSVELAPTSNGTFEPESLEVAAGTSEIVFRRVSVDPDVGRWIEVVDEQTGLVLGDSELYAWIVWARGPDTPSWADTHDCKTWYAGQDEEPFVVEWDSFQWLVAHPGYRSLSGTKENLSARESIDPARGDKRIRFELERGILREVFVYVGDGEPVPGAVLSDSKGILGTTDVEGVAIVDAAHWPDRVEVECTGFLPTRWFPADDWDDWQPTWIELERDR